MSVARSTRPRLRGTLVAMGVALAATALPCRLALAQAPPTRAEQMLAQSLFDEGRTLMTAGRYAEACPKLAESQRLDPGGGTLLNLALCHEKEGKVATSYLELQEAIAQAGREGRRERVQIANEHLAQIAPRLPRLTVRVGNARRPDGYEITLDGTPLRAPAWGVPAVVDPGEHVVEARAPGHAPSRAVVTIAEGESKVVEAAPLAPLTADAPADLPASGGETRANPWHVASAGAVAGGSIAAGVAGMVWLISTLQRRAGCVTERDFCSETALTAARRESTSYWIGATSLAVTAAGAVGLVVFPSRIHAAASPTRGGATASVTFTF